MPDKLTPANIVEAIERFVALCSENAELDYLVGTGQSIDVGRSACIFAEMEALEQQLLTTGIWRQVTQDAIARYRRSP